MLIAARNAMMAGKSSILPPGARWVEYLESTGTQYIDTGIRWNTSMDFSITFLTDVSHGYEKYLMGYGLYNTNNCLSCEIYSSSNALAIKKNAYWQKTFYFNLHQKNTLQKQGSIISSIRSTYEYNGDYFECARNCFVFATQVSSGGAYGNSRVKCYSFDMDPIRLRPIAIGTTGYMLDLVSGEYLPYGNKGTGAFVIGPDIAGGGGISANA